MRLHLYLLTSLPGSWGHSFKELIMYKGYCMLWITRLFFLVDFTLMEMPLVILSASYNNYVATFF